MVRARRVALRLVPRPVQLLQDAGRFRADPRAEPDAPLLLPVVALDVLRAERVVAIQDVAREPRETRVARRAAAATRVGGRRAVAVESPAGVGIRAHAARAASIRRFTQPIVVSVVT